MQPTRDEHAPLGWVLELAEAEQPSRLPLRDAHEFSDARTADAFFAKKGLGRRYTASDAARKSARKKK